MTVMTGTDAMHEFIAHLLGQTAGQEALAPFFARAPFSNRCDEFFSNSFGLNGQVTIVARFSSPKRYVLLCGSFNAWSTAAHASSRGYTPDSADPASPVFSSVDGPGGIVMKPFVLSPAQLQQLETIHLARKEHPSAPGDSGQPSLAHNEHLFHHILSSAQFSSPDDSTAHHSRESAASAHVHLLQSVHHTWIATLFLDPSKEGEHYSYKFYADGQWMQSVESRVLVNDGHGGHNHAFVIPPFSPAPTSAAMAGSAAAPAPASATKNVPTGSVLLAPKPAAPHAALAKAHEKLSRVLSANSSAMGPEELEAKLLSDLVTFDDSASSLGLMLVFKEKESRALKFRHYYSSATSAVKSRLLARISSEFRYTTSELENIEQMVRQAFMKDTQGAAGSSIEAVTQASLAPAPAQAQLPAASPLPSQGPGPSHPPASQGKLDSRPPNLVIPANGGGLSSEGPVPLLTPRTSRKATLSFTDRDAFLQFTPSYDRMFDTIASTGGGVRFLVNFRADLVAEIKQLQRGRGKPVGDAPAPGSGPAGAGLEARIQQLELLSLCLMRKLSSWFIVDILQIRPITGLDSPALKRCVIESEAVHPFTSWKDFSRRLDGRNRKMFGLFHPSMPDIPLVFLEVALTKGLGSNINSILNGEDAHVQTGELDTVTFYSINATQEGLSGMELAGHMIYRAMTKLQDEGWVKPYESAKAKQRSTLDLITESEDPATRSSPSPVSMTESFDDESDSAVLSPSSSSSSTSASTSSLSSLSSPSSPPLPNFDPAVAKKAFQRRRVSTLETQTVITFATLSPIPSFGSWLRAELDKNPPDAFFHTDDVDQLSAFAQSDPSLAACTSAAGILSALIARDITQPDVLGALEKPLMRLCLHYLLEVKQGKKVADPVANFHMGNGAVLERLNWAAWLSPKGIRQSFGIMANYLYATDGNALAQRVKEYKTAGVVHTAPALTKWKTIQNFFRATAKLFVRTPSQESAAAFPSSALSS